MSCQIKRNKEGKIELVLDVNSNESQLFNTIVKSPLIKDSEQAYSIYKNVYDSEEGNQFVYQVGEQTFTSYKSALKTAKENEEIKAGFLKDEKFKSIVSTVKTTNKNTEQGFINNTIEAGLLKDEKIKLGVETFYKADSDTELSSYVIAQLVIDDAQAYLGSKGVKKDGNLLKFDKTLGKIKVKSKSGELKFVEKSDIDNMSREELLKEYDNADDIIIAREYNNSRVVKRANKLEVSEEPLVRTSEDELQMKLLNFLNKLGVKITSISEYNRNYKAKNGVNPSAKALADIANGVIAVMDNRISLQDLTEETAHFIVASLPQEAKENILRNIEKSKEWAQHSQAYFEIYSQEYSETDALEATKEEVLGKIVANALQSNFQDKSQQNFMEKALEFVQQFFATIQSYFQPQYRQELDSYLKDVQNLLETEDISSLVDIENLKNNKFRLYSVSNSGSVESRIVLASKRALMTQTEISRQLRRSGAAKNLVASQVREASEALDGGRESDRKILASTDEAELQNVEKLIQENQQLLAVSTLVDVAKTSVNQIEVAIRDSKEKGNTYLLTDEENVVFLSLTKSLKPSLQELKALSIEANKGKEWETLNKRIDQVLTEISNLEGEAKVLNNQVIDKWVDRIVTKYGYPESFKQHIYGWVDQAKKDTDLLHAYYGQLAHANDAMLNLLGRVTDEMTNETHLDWTEDTNTLFKSLRENGVDIKEMDKLAENGFFIDEIDHYAFQQAKRDNYTKAYNETYGLNLTTEEVQERRKNNTLDLDKELEVMQKTKELDYEIQESRMTKEYMDNYKATLEKANLSDLTKNILTSYFADMSVFREKALNEEGQLDMSRLSAQEEDGLNHLLEQRASMKSYTNELGELKAGLESYVDSEGKAQVRAIEGAIISESAQVALDLNRLDVVQKEARGGTTTEEGTFSKFYEKLRQIDQTKGRDEALRFLKMNSYMGFTSEFWDNISSGKSIVQKLQSAVIDLDATERVKVEELMQEIADKNLRMKNILKIYTDKNNPAEIKTDKMSNVAKDTIQTLSTDLQALFERAKSYTKNITNEDVDNAIELSESTLNTAYYSQLKDEGIFVEEEDSEETRTEKYVKQFDFSQNHMTDFNKKAVLKAKFAIEDYLRGATTTLPFSLEMALEEYQADYNLEDSNFVAEFLAKYAEQKVLPYYKRYAFSGYSEFIEEMKTTKDLVSHLQNKSDILQLSPNYSFLDEVENGNINPNFRKNYKGGYVQPKKGMFESQTFKDLFGETQKDEMGNYISSSKNQKLFEVYKTTLKLNEKRLQDTGVSKGYNLFTAPQIRQKGLERTQKLISEMSMEQMRNSFQDFFNFTEDDQATGDLRFGADVKVIPQEFIQEVPKEDLSNQVFLNMTMGLKAGATRKARQKYFGDVMAIADKISTRDYNGKSIDKVNTIKMMNSFVDNAIYGIKEQYSYPIETPFGTVDLAKIAKVFAKYISLRNLGLNWVIPVTSAVTGKINSMIEAQIGDVFNKRSYALGKSEFRRLMPKGMTEIGKIEVKAKINVLGRVFQAFDVEQSYENSSYKGFLRFLPRTGMALHSAANFPIYGENLLAVLHDYRIVDGQMINFVTFRNQLENEGKSKKDIETDWNKYETETFYKYIDVVDGALKIDKKQLKDKLLNNGEQYTEEELDVEIKDIVSRVSTYSKLMNEYVDGQLTHGDRVLAQRHALMSFTMIHRGWLSIATQRRFKGEHLNMKTMQMEEGSYITLWKFLGGYIKEYKGKNFANFVGNFSEQYKNLPSHKRTNMRRIGIEMATLSAIVLLKMMLTRWADDEDEKDNGLLQFTAYMAERTANEVSSTQAGISKSFYETIKAPIIGIDNVTNVAKVWEAFDSDIVKGGVYGGMEKSDRYFIKTIPGMKSFYDATDYYQTRKTFEYFQNQGINSDYFSGTGLLFSELMKPKEE